MSKPQFTLLALVIFMLILSSVNVAMAVQFMLVQIPLNGYNFINSADIIQEAANMNAVSLIIQRSIVGIF
jgi:hypothetical protein